MMTTPPRCEKPFEELDAIGRAELVRDVACWNAWRAESKRRDEEEGRPPAEIDLSGADLDGARLKGIDLTDVDLRGASLRRTDLSDADLSRADLSPLPAGTGGSGEREKPARLTDADLGGAKLVGADLRDAVLVGTNLYRADLRGCRSFRLDSTLTRGAYLSSRSGDEWSVLRRSYTGPRMVFNLLFMVAFFLPYGVRAAGWAAASSAQERARVTADEVLSAASAASRAAAAIAASNAAASSADISSAAAGGAATPGDTAVTAALESARSALLERLPAPGAPGWERTPVWKLLLGVDRGALFWVTAVALLLYNVLRWVLTTIVAPMRDEEDRSGVSPPYRRPTPPFRPHAGRRLSPGAWRDSILTWARSWGEAYGGLLRCHAVVRGLFVVAVASFLFHARDWLSLAVWTPAG